LFLGGAVAAAACRRAPRGRAQVPTTIVDQAVDVGHLLRGGPPPAPTGRERVGVAIVGGGVAGLTCAWRLAGAAFADVAVLELDVREGGTSQSGRTQNGVHPWGAHYLPAPLEDRGPVVRLLRELGAVTGTDAS